MFNCCSAISISIVSGCEDDDGRLTVRHPLCCTPCAMHRRAWGFHPARGPLLRRVESIRLGLAVSAAEDTRPHLRLPAHTDGSSGASSASMTAATGYVAILISAVGFGSNFLPVKRCQTGNGLSYQFFFCWSVLLVGLFFGMHRGFPSTPPLALAGGALWCTGNLISVPCIKLVGMGLAILLWGISNMLVGWASGTFGLFGLNPTPASDERLNYAGVAVALASLIVYIFVKPEDHQSSAGPGTRSRAATPKDGNGGGSGGFGPSFHSSLVMEEGGGSGGGAAAASGVGGSSRSTQHDRHGADVFLPGLQGTRRFVLGAVLALVAGCFYGASFNPAQYVIDHAKQPGSGYERYASLELVDFVWPHFCGIFLASSAYFLLYLLASYRCCNGGRHRSKRGAAPEVYPAAILPAFASGGLWAVAMCAWFVANQSLSMSITFPIVTSTPGLVAALWGVLVFHEIKGRRNLLLLATAFGLTLTACLLIGFSM